MSEDNRKDPASGKGASKDKAPASAPESKDTAQTASASSSPSSVSGQASAPATDVKPAKGECEKHAGSDQSAGKSPGKTKSANKTADKSKTSSASTASDRGASGATSAPARSQSGGTGTAAASRPTTAGSSAAASGSGGTPQRGTPAGNSGDNGGGGAKLIAVIAVVIALIAIVLSGWVLYRGQGQLGSVDSRLDTVEKGMQSNVQDVVMPRIKRLDSRVQSLGGDLDSQSQTVSSLSDKLSAAQESLQQTQARAAQMEDQLSGNKTRWDLNQIEALLQAANQRLQLYNDPNGARQALKLANEAIGRKGDPRLFKLRGEIVNEIASLEALPDPDLEGMSLALAAMIERVPDLPLASSVPGEYSQNDDAAQAGDGKTSEDSGMSVAQWQAEFSKGWDHFKGSVGDALSGMLTIRRSDGTQRALLPPEQAFFLGQNLQLQLRSARLAMLKRDTQNYRDSLASAKQWLGDYYDTNAAPVSSMQERIGQMSNVKLDWDAPDISSSLIMLREIMASRSGPDSGNSSNSSAGDGAGEDGQ